MRQCTRHKAENDYIDTELNTYNSYDISPRKGFYECNVCETGYDKGQGNYCLDVDECFTVGCPMYDGLPLLCHNTEGL